MALIPCDHSVCDYDCDYDRDCDYDHDDQSYWSDMDSLYAMSFGSGGTCCPSPSEIGEDEDGHFGLEAEGFKIAHEVRYGKDMMKRAEEKERRRRKRLERRTNRGGRRRTRRVRVGRGRGCGFKEEGAEDLGIVAVEVTEDVSEDVIEIPTGLNRTEDGSRGSEVEGESLSWPRSLEHLDELQETGVGMGAGSSHAEVQLSDLMRPVRSRTGRGMSLHRCLFSHTLLAYLQI